MKEEISKLLAQRWLIIKRMTLDFNYSYRDKDAFIKEHNNQIDKIDALIVKLATGKAANLTPTNH